MQVSTVTEMTVEDIPSLKSLSSCQCETLGEISFSYLQRQQQNLPVKIWVNNLPKGITESGVKNLFLSVGKPLSISFNYPKNSALVLFEFMKEAELAVRDLHCKPPYNLKIKLVNFKLQNETEETKIHEAWDFSHQESPAKIEVDDCSKKINEVVIQIGNIIKNLGYNPSVRMRQKKLDFKTKTECVSFGRGYLYMGDSDRFVGGLQKFQSSSKDTKCKDKMNFFCENCQALTTKICGYCSTSFCSKACLRNSTVDHKNCSTPRYEGEQQYLQDNHSNSTLNFSCSIVSSNSFPQVPLKTGCSVVISTYLTMKTVFVRCSDEPWEEKFTRLCNDVAVEALKGGNSEKMPEIGDLVLAKYYEDLCFYRAQVRSCDKEKATLFFIDFGNTQETKIEDLKPLPDHLKSEPAFAVKVHLKDVLEGSSLDSINYFNKLTADRILLVLEFKNTVDEVVLIEKDSKVVVNETVTNFILPSWKKDEYICSKLGEVFYLDSIKPQKFEVGKSCNLIISHFDEKEFLESEVFWVTDPETDDFFHSNSEMWLRIREYCEFLKDDCYLPRVNELCLAKEDGEWHRCVNLKSHKTICCLFFLDDGHSSLIETNNIRKMIRDFIEAPAQAVCCTLPDDPKLKTNSELQSKVVKYLKESTGQAISSVSILKLMGDAYCLSFPEISKLLA